MRHSILILVAIAAASTATAQPDWQPPSTTLPTMPDRPTLDALGAWGDALARAADAPASAVQVLLEGRSAQGVARLVRLRAGRLPVAVLSDRNGDGRADLVEIFRNGVLAFQVIDPDYDGRADVVRRYDTNGALMAEHPPRR